MTSENQTTGPIGPPPHQGSGGRAAPDLDTAGRIMRSLKERWKIEAEFSEPGHDRWRVHKARAELLREIITEFWDVK